jgi:hypothetical protein
MHNPQEFLKIAQDRDTVRMIRFPRVQSSTVPDSTVPPRYDIPPLTPSCTRRYSGSTVHHPKYKFGVQQVRQSSKMQDLEGMKGLITCYLVQVPVTGKRYED